MENQPKTYTRDELKKIAPGYRGKPENLDPHKIKTGKPNQKQAKTQRPPTEMPPPTQLDDAKKPTPQKNSPLWAASIFGIDTSVRELQVNLEFQNSFANLKNIVSEVYSALGTDDKSLTKSLTKEMLMYYATSLHLWLRLIQIKAQRAHSELTTTERDYLRILTDEELNVPQPIYLYIKAIGHVNDKTGKEIYISDHVLPVTNVVNRTGYHTTTMTSRNHCLFEEVPSLGVCGDVLMAQASRTETNPTFEFVPAGRTANRNLAGYFGSVSVQKEEIVLLLESLGISNALFQENIENTRVNLKLIQYVSDYLQSSKTKEMKKSK